jgi:hypothetical protein
VAGHIENLLCGDLCLAARTREKDRSLRGVLQYLEHALRASIRRSRVVEKDG